MKTPGRIGVGVGYRNKIADQIRESDTIDVVEIIADQFFDGVEQDRTLLSLVERYAVIPHGIGLSVGSCGLLDFDYLSRARSIVQKTASQYYSEHLCISAVPGIDLGHLSPVVRTQESLNEVVRTVDIVQDYLGVPLVLENTTDVFQFPASDMTTPQFFSELTARTGCGLLLDLTNVYINSVNHGFDPGQYIRSMPIESLVQVHLAGGVTRADGFLMDTHSQMVPKEVWEILEYVARLREISTVIIEHDSNFESAAAILDQVTTAKMLAYGAGAGCTQCKAG